MSAVWIASGIETTTGVRVMDLTASQAWLLLGVPALVGGLTLYTSRWRWLGLLGMLVLLAAAVAMATVDRASAAVLGGVMVLLYAAGRGGGGAVVGDDPVRRSHDPVERNYEESRED